MPQNNHQNKNSPETTPDPKGTTPRNGWRQHSLNQISDQINSLDQQIGRLSERFDGQIHKIEERFDRRIRETEDRINQKIKELGDRLGTLEKLVWTASGITVVVGAVIGYIGLLLRDAILVLMPLFSG